MAHRVVPNEEIAIKGISASFAAVGILGALGVLFLMVPAAMIGARLVKPKTV